MFLSWFENIIYFATNTDRGTSLTAQNVVVKSSLAGPIFCSVMWKIHLLVGCFVGGGFRDLYLHDELQGIRPTEEYLKRFSLTPPLPHVSGSAASSQSHHMDLESDDYAL